MGEFLQNNWFWIVLLGFFFWMHASGRGCGGHGRAKREGHGGGGHEDQGNPPQSKEKAPTLSEERPHH